jgi:dihydroflavonol-4-reductase
VTKTLVMGAAGFTGSRVARKLQERGDELRLAVPPRGSAELIEDLDCERVACDLLDRAAIRRAVKGMERVFHVGGDGSIPRGDAERLFAVKVGGTKTVMEECLRAGVERVVYTSSAAALGPARPGGTADETQLFTAGRLGIPHVNSLHEAEVEAMRLAAKGLALVCINPCVTFGAGDVHLTSTRLVRDFLLGRVQVYVEGAINVVDVEDVAAGHLLADERGGVGERYILGGRNFTFERLFADLARLSGIDPPVRLPASIAQAGAAALARGPGPSPSKLAEVRAASQWWTYRATKAHSELGWAARPHEETGWPGPADHDRSATAWRVPPWAPRRTCSS